MEDLTPQARASWRRFWKNGPQTPRQVADAAFERIEEARATAGSRQDELLAVDPYDAYLVELGTDPVEDQQARATRVEAMQTTRHRRRREDRQRRGK